MPTSVLSDHSLIDKIPLVDEKGVLIPHTKRVQMAILQNCKPITEAELGTKYSCVLCCDGPSEIDMVHYGKTGTRRRCACALARDARRRFDRAVELTPRKYREQHGITDGLNSMVPMPDVHPKQPATLENLKRNAEKSFYIFGRTGAYKTTFAWALIQEAGRRGQPVGGNTGKSLIDTLRNYAFDKKLPRDGASFYELGQLENNETRYCLLIDDIDGLVITEYTFGLLWDLLDKVQAYDQQLIITANKSIDRLLNEWATRDRDGRANAVNFCEKIARRLKEICVDVDLS